MRETIAEINKQMFVGKKLVDVTGNDDYIRYHFEDGSYFEQYQHSGEINWISVDQGLPNTDGCGPTSEPVLVQTDAYYWPTISTGYYECGDNDYESQWHVDNPKVLRKNKQDDAKVLYWAHISRPIKHY